MPKCKSIQIQLQNDGNAFFSRSCRNQCLFCAYLTQLQCKWQLQLRLQWQQSLITLSPGTPCEAINTWVTELCLLSVCGWTIWLMVHWFQSHRTDSKQNRDEKQCNIVDKVWALETEWSSEWFPLLLRMFKLDQVAVTFSAWTTQKFNLTHFSAQNAQAETFVRINWFKRFMPRSDFLSPLTKIQMDPPNICINCTVLCRNSLLTAFPQSPLMPSGHTFVFQWPLG